MKRTKNIVRHSLVPIPLLLVATFVLSPAALAQVVGDWNPTGSLNVPRDGHTATVLADGKVLVVGGRNGNILDTAELFDPASGTWSVTASLNTPRFLHTATLLPNGKVLVAGGITNSTLTNSAELYDPATGIWSVTGSLNIARFWCTATLLANGKVLVVAGAGGESSAELYDPTTEIWSVTGGLNVARYGQTVTLLQDGKVLIAGGSNDGDLASVLNSAELYDPATGTWSITGDLNTARISHTATLLHNGKVLVAAGYAPNFVPVGGGVSVTSPTSLNDAELYDPITGTWSIAVDLNARRDSHTATLLKNGSVLIVGGGFWTSGGNTPNDGTAPCFPCSFKARDSGELYDPATGRWAATARLNAGRDGHTATLLQSGKVLVAGGHGIGGVALNSAELYDDSVPSPLTVGGLLAEAEVGVPFSGDLQIAGGQSPYVISIVNGSLPPGLNLTSSNLAGTPTSAGNKPFTIRVLDQMGASVTRSLRMKIVKALGISTANLQLGRTGKKFNTSLKAAGGKKPFTWSLVSGTQPPGLALDPVTGKITGIPTVAGISDLTFRVTDSLGGNFEQTLTLIIN